MQSWCLARPVPEPAWPYVPYLLTLKVQRFLPVLDP